MLLEPLRTLVLAIWTAAGVPTTADAPAIASAVAQAVADDADNAPVYTSHAEDLAVMAVYVVAESNVRVHPIAYSWDAKAGVSCGAFQVPCFVVRAQSLVGQAKYVLRLMHLGALTCPEQPLAPVIGSCRAGRAQADWRVTHARELLRVALES